MGFEPGPQDGRRRRIHWDMVAAQYFKVITVGIQHKSSTFELPINYVCIDIHELGL